MVSTPSSPGHCGQPAFAACSKPTPGANVGHPRVNIPCVHWPPGSFSPATAESLSRRSRLLQPVPCPCTALSRALLGQYPALGPFFLNACCGHYPKGLLASAWGPPPLQLTLLPHTVSGRQMCHQRAPQGDSSGHW